mgnify:CR=1 FL=1
MLHLLREEEVGRAVEEWEEKGKGETRCTSNKQQGLTISHVICFFICRVLLVFVCPRFFSIEQEIFGRTIMTSSVRSLPYLISKTSL